MIDQSIHSSEPPALVIFSGLGADERLLAPQRALEARMEVPPWIEPRRGETLPDYAARIAGTIRTPRPYHVGGVSFGAVIALEVARHVDPQAVFMIAGCRSRDDVVFPFRSAAPLVDLTPERLVKWLGLHLPGWMRFAGARTGDQRRLIRDSICNGSPTFIKWAMGEFLRWRGVAPTSVPIHQIHGDRDRILRVPSEGSVTVIPGGPHLINLTHPDVVNEFIQRHLTADAPRRAP